MYSSMYLIAVFTVCCHELVGLSLWIDAGLSSLHRQCKRVHNNHRVGVNLCLYVDSFNAATGK